VRTVRGDVHALKANQDARGREQAGRRYGIVVQADALIHASTWFVVPTSSKAGAASYRPEVTVKGEMTRALCDQAAAIDPQARLGAVVGHLSYDELQHVGDALRLLLDL